MSFSLFKHGIYTYDGSLPSGSDAAIAINTSLTAIGNNFDSVLSAVGTPTAGHFPALTSGGLLVDSGYSHSSFLPIGGGTLTGNLLLGTHALEFTNAVHVFYSSPTLYIGDVTDVYGGGYISISNPTDDSEGTFAVSALKTSIDGGQINTDGGGNMTANSYYLSNGTYIEQGTTNTGGNYGISLYCYINYEMNWQAGTLYLKGPTGSTNNLVVNGASSFDNGAFYTDGSGNLFLTSGELSMEGHYINLDGYASLYSDGSGNVTLGNDAATFAIQGNTTIAGTSGYGLTVSGSATSLDNGNIVTNGSGSLTANGKVVASNLVEIKGISINAGSSIISTGVAGSVQIPFDATITGWRIISPNAVTGSIQFNIQSATYAAFPTGTNLITSNYPIMTSAVKAESSTLSGWTTSLNGGDYLIFSVTSVSTLTQVRLEVTLATR